jgi:hypothetical protein
MRRFAHIERGNQGRHQARVRRKWPGLGRGTQQHAWRLPVALESIPFDDVSQLMLRNAGNDRPRAFGQGPLEQACRARTAEHQAWIGDQVDELLGSDQKTAAG